MSDRIESERRLADLWEQHQIYRFAPDDDSRPVFSIDTPPPYVSATNLHPGHAMSFAQADIAVRYMRKQGHNVFYPMGFDDNGLPTERFVEKKYGIDKRSMTKQEFVSLCLTETELQAKNYARFFKKLGISVDWSLSYSTISPRAQRIAQLSFLDLFKKGLIERRNEPILWCPSCETALAQSDLEDEPKKSQLHFIRFGGEDSGIQIATSRPEYLAACVALFVHPDDERYTSWIGNKITVPLFGHSVPIVGDTEVDPTYGTGAMMVCTWGDSEDVRRWKEFSLDTREIIRQDGITKESTPIIGEMSLGKARKATLEALKQGDYLLSSTEISHEVKCHERCGHPSEFITTTQWFIKIADRITTWSKQSNALVWFPEEMKSKLDAWINGLKYDWCISRQRYFGVPFPVWYCKDCGATLLPPSEALPIDPTEKAYPGGSCTHCNSTQIEPDRDVMDTWMTSSLTPLINAHWGEPGHEKLLAQIYPMSLRVQAFEIIRTWLFYTLVKGEYHTGSLPWETVMISGWGLDKHGKKISKSSGVAADAEAIIDRHSADALRYWASSAELGSNHRFKEEELKTGRRLVIKLENAAKFVGRYLGEFANLRTNPATCELAPSDIWVLKQLQEALKEYHKHFEVFDYFKARKALDAFFWNVFCDNYLEFVKHRLKDNGPQQDRQAALATLEYCMRVVTHMYAPYIPFATEEIYQNLFVNGESWTSVHTELMPLPEIWIDALCEDKTFAETLLVVDQIRKYRSAQQIGFGTPIARVTIDGPMVDQAFLKAALNVIEINLATKPDEPFLNTPTCRIWFDAE